MFLLNLCLLGLAASFLLLWRLPIVAALLTLVLFDAVFVAGMLRLGVGQLHRLLR
jgi:hypothetical protein